MSKYVRFTRGAQRATRYAQDEAVSLKHGYVGEEHILLGLLREKSGLAAQALKNLGMELGNLRSEVDRLTGEASKDFDFNQKTPVFTTRAQEAVELAVIEGYNLGQGYVGTEHLLLGLIKKEGMAVQILENLDMEPEEVYEEIISMMGGDPGDASWWEDLQKGASECQSCQEGLSLKDFGRDLTALAEEDKLEPIIGREEELERIIQILNRRTKNNPCLIGEAGVGKTAVAEGLAQKIIRDEVPDNLRDKRVVQLELSSLIAGTKHRGEFEERMQQLLQELQESGNVIVFVDEIHTVVGAGAAEGALDASNILKPALSRGELQVIGATTLEEYRKYVESDAALERRFQPVMVEEPTEEESLQIIRGLRDRYQDHHRVEITDEALEAAVRYGSRYIQDRFLPDKAIDLMDEASALVKIHQLPFTLARVDDERGTELEEVKRQKEEAVGRQDYEKAAELRDRQQELEEDKEFFAAYADKEYGEDSLPDSTEGDYPEQSHKLEEEAGDQAAVTEEDVAQVVSNWTGIPVYKLTEEESEMLMRLEKTLHQKVVGQEEAVEAVAKAIRRGRTGLQNPRRPQGSFMFLGPTGVGKTELSRRLAEVLFGDEQAVLRLDMSEYMESHATARLVGAPPGYVGYDEGGQLTEQVRRKPYSVILLDEIEKAHPEVFNVLLQILEDGRLTDGKGHTVSFRHAVIIMTSNLGARLLQGQSTVGFRPNGEEAEYAEMEKGVLEELRGTFRPEFLNRLDDVIVFKHLTREDLNQIVDLMLQELSQRMAQYGLELRVTAAARKFLAHEGYHPSYGARPLKRVIQKRVEDRLSDELIGGNFQPGDVVEVDAEEKEGEEELTFCIRTPVAEKR